MSAKNYLSAREKASKLVDSLPNICKQKFSIRSGQELPLLSANTSNLVNRNLNYSYQLDQYTDNLERSGTPFSDFFSESETDTPDILSEESDSSAGSALRRNTAEATRALIFEWEKIERTLYNEEGEKCTRPEMIEECMQWRKLHPHLRIVGRAIKLPEKRLCFKQTDQEEVIGLHYSDYEQFSESEARLSESSTDVTPQNSPRGSMPISDFEPKLSREKISFYHTFDEKPELPDDFCSMLQITPVQLKSPLHRKKYNTSILKSDMASSKWMKNSRPDSSVYGERNSAKSFVSLDFRNYGNFALSASDNSKVINNRILTAKNRELTKLEPLYTPEMHNDFSRFSNGFPFQCNIRKVSLPPLLLGEDKKKVVSINSGKKHGSGNIRRNRKSGTKSRAPLDRVFHNEP